MYLNRRAKFVFTETQDVLLALLLLLWDGNVHFQEVLQLGVQNTFNKTWSIKLDRIRDLDLQIIGSEKERKKSKSTKMCIAHNNKRKNG